ncbi:uncharacterized protein B0P05DRAFT_552737 [Gilbertella persicaria]|uniref:uncharacterized protein n=1 Tax=Gilbertella persicaria TaxID=101096 RepID=UPI002220CCB3|nr:uncharacterized protein B0P05DRAFT_552737 [Gilbertella persicaria]KAI8067723.1 hypothetical protein B0P05DRAFT_552737 [Gilbertella persicaria]
MLTLPKTKMLSLCRPFLSLDPILWMPMINIERSRLIRWRLEWLPGGSPKPCSCGQHLSHSHAINCLSMHVMLNQPTTVSDPLSHLLNRLSITPPKNNRSILYWGVKWTSIHTLLSQVGAIQLANMEPLNITPTNQLSPFLLWLQTYAHKKH